VTPGLNGPGLNPLDRLWKVPRYETTSKEYFPAAAIRSRRGGGLPKDHPFLQTGENTYWDAFTLRLIYLCSLLHACSVALTKDVATMGQALWAQ
jgi:hypothetical protein